MDKEHQTIYDDRSAPETRDEGIGRYELIRQRNKAERERDELASQLGASLAREANEHSRAEMLRSERDELLAALQIADEGISKLEGQSIEYPIAIHLSNVSDIVKRAIAKAEGRAQ